MKLTITVRDTPRPGGSKTPGFNHKTGKAFVRPANKHTATWRDSVRSAALLAYQGPPLRGAFRVDCTFYFNRPQAHFRSGKNWHLMKDDAPMHHTKMPDRTKLLRSTEDALTGIIWVDDAQVVDGIIAKAYCGPADYEGCVLVITSLEEGYE